MIRRGSRSPRRARSALPKIGASTTWGRPGVDWIERIFGVEPDMGSGALEILIVGAIVLIVAGVVVTRRRTAEDREKVN